MSSLPHEILTNIFSLLGRKNLLQCQLTNEQWHKVSSTYLYSNVVLNSEKKALAYVRTISNSSHLGKYLKTIIFRHLFDQEESSPVCDKHGLLKAIIQYCPNITKIDSDSEDVRLYNILLYAVTQGQLSHLKVLPLFGVENLESFIYTALAFKNSLTNLSIYDSRSFYQPELANLVVYRTLCDQIDEFKNLQHLDLTYASNKYLSHFDELIDKCHGLKGISFFFTW